MLKKIMAFPRFLKCNATKSEKAKALIKFAASAGKKDIVVGNNAFKITKL